MVEKGSWVQKHLKGNKDNGHMSQSFHSEIMFEICR